MSTLSQTSSAHYDCGVYLSLANKWIQVTQKHIQLEPTEILVWLKRVSRDNPVFLDPLTSRRLVVLARSWSCQPSIYGRSVFNLQKWTLPEYRERMKARGSGGNEASTFVCVFECQADLCFWTLLRMIRLGLDVSEICVNDRQSHFEPSCGSVCLLWKELCKWLYVSVCGCAQGCGKGGVTVKLSS